MGLSLSLSLSLTLFPKYYGRDKSWVGYEAFMGEMRNKYTQKSAGNRSIRRAMSILKVILKLI
jgi:hypothetical protein